MLEPTKIGTIIGQTFDCGSMPKARKQQQNCGYIYEPPVRGPQWTLAGASGGRSSDLPNPLGDRHCR